MNGVRSAESQTKISASIQIDYLEQYLKPEWTSLLIRRGLWIRNDEWSLQSHIYASLSTRYLTKNTSQLYLPLKHSASLSDTLIFTALLKPSGLGRFLDAHFSLVFIRLVTKSYCSPSKILLDPLSLSFIPTATIII